MGRYAQIHTMVSGVNCDSLLGEITDDCLSSELSTTDGPNVCKQTLSAPSWEEVREHFSFFDSYMLPPFFCNLLTYEVGRLLSCVS